MNNNKTIAKNTLYLYFRMIVIIAINLFAVRIILKVLGIEDYGIYNVVGGIVTLFSFLSSSLSSGAQRFFAYEIGHEDYNQLQKVFSMTVMVYCGMAFMILVLLETVGPKTFVRQDKFRPKSRFSHVMRAELTQR